MLTACRDRVRSLWKLESIITSGKPPSLGRSILAITLAEDFDEAAGLYQEFAEAG